MEGPEEEGGDLRRGSEQVLCPCREFSELSLGQAHSPRGP